MNSQFVVGIDVGGQTTKLGVVDARYSACTDSHPY